MKTKNGYNNIFSDELTLMGNKIKGLAKKVYEAYVKHPVRNTLVAGLIGATGITALKDNVHFVLIGTIEFYNPEKNQYVWGILPFTRIREASKDYYLDEVKGITSFGFIASNTLEDSPHARNMNAYSLILGINSVGDNSRVEGMGAYGILGINEVRNNSRVEDMNAYGLFGGINNVGNGTEINGQINSRVLMSGTPTGTSLGTRIEDFRGRDYVHQIKEEIK